MSLQARTPKCSHVTKSWNMQGRQWNSQPWTLSKCCFIMFHHISYFFITSVVMENCPQEPCPRTMALPSKTVFFERFVWSTHPPNLKKHGKKTSGLLRNSYKTSFRLPSPGMKLPGKDLEQMKVELFCVTPLMLVLGNYLASYYTPETNMLSEKGYLEKGKHLHTTNFRVPC